MSTGKQLHVFPTQKLNLRQARAISMTVLLLSSFFVLWAPYVIYYTLKLTRNPLVPSSYDGKKMIGRVLTALTCCNAMADGVIYFIRSNDALNSLSSAKHKYKCSRS